MNVKTELLATRGMKDAMQLNEVELDPFAIKAIMINEVVPVDPSQDFYGKPGADYSKSALFYLKTQGQKRNRPMISCAREFTLPMLSRCRKQITPLRKAPLKPAFRI